MSPKSKFSIVSIENNADYFIKSFRIYQEIPFETDNHYHELYEIILFEKGEGEVIYNGNSHRISSPQLFYCPPFVSHDFTIATSTLVYTKLHFVYSFIDEQPMAPILLKLGNDHFFVLKKLLELTKDSSLSDNFKQNLITTILLWVIEFGHTQCRKNIHPKLKPLAYYIKNNRYNFPNSTEAAKICNLSKSTFNRLFKESLKKSYHNFLLNIKIEEAKNLLNSGKYSCSRISEILDFSNPSHFTKKFKEFTGVLPKDFPAKTLKMNTTEERLTEPLKE